MRADEYIVEQLKITQEQLRVSKECNNKIKNDYKQLQEQTEKYCKLLDELKQHCVMSKSGNLKTIKIIHDQEFLLKRNIAYSDEHIFDILLELLGPLEEEAYE